MADDGIKLTDEEQEQINAAIRGSRGYYESTVRTHAAVESIVAARVRDLTDSHELMATQFRTMQREKEHGWREAEKWEVKADAFAAELAAANTRIDEAEIRIQRIIELEPVAHAAEQLRESDGSFSTEIAGVRLEKCDEYGQTRTTRENVALSARLEQVRALAEWKQGDDSAVLKSEIRAALGEDA